MCDFKPGDEVVALDGWIRAARDEGLVEGRVYVVERVGPSKSGHTIMLDLEGIPTARFEYRGFRKVQRKSTETGMEILRKALDDASVVIAAREGA